MFRKTLITIGFMALSSAPALALDSQTPCPSGYSATRLENNISFDAPYSRYPIGELTVKEASEKSVGEGILGGIGIGGGTYDVVKTYAHCQKDDLIKQCAVFDRSFKDGAETKRVCKDAVEPKTCQQAFMIPGTPNYLMCDPSTGGSFSDFQTSCVVGGGTPDRIEMREVACS